MRIVTSRITWIRDGPGVGKISLFAGRSVPDIAVGTAFTYQIIITDPLPDCAPERVVMFFAPRT